MSSFKDLKLAEKSALQQAQVILELNAIVKDIERCERSILDLQKDLETVNSKHKDRKSTREDIAYLEDLLKCANKKLTWEKHIASLQKRTPSVLERMMRVMNDPVNPPPDETRAQMLQSLQAVQAAMERLQKAKVE
jgi:cob(I)alamin adenosyltransferase